MLIPLIRLLAVLFLSIYFLSALINKYWIYISQYKQSMSFLNFLFTPDKELKMKLTSGQKKLKAFIDTAKYLMFAMLITESVVAVVLMSR
jgi:hypothetical protein